MKKQKGISLIVLIVTIVVIIILAASIILNLSNSNLIGNAKKAVLMQDIATLKSDLELYVADEYVDAKGKYDRVNLNANKDTATYGTETVADKNGDGSSNIYDILKSLKNTSWNGKVYIKEGVLVFKNNNLSKEEIKTILGAGVYVEGIPQIREIGVQSGYTNITVSLNVENADEVEKYIYIFNNGEPEESTETIKAYTGLTVDTNYMFEVIAVLSNGIEISKKQIISTKSLNGTIVYTKSETEWTNQDVKVTIEYSEEILEGYELQYKLSGSVTQDWTKYTEAVTITENATTLVGRVYNSILDEEKVGSSVVISNIDKEVPTVPTELNLTSGKDSITATASGSTDTTSGVEHYEYSMDGTTWQTKVTFTGLEIGEYTVYARAVDYAGNVSEVKTGVIEVKIQINITVEYVDLLNAKVSIDYGNVTSPEYKIGTNGTWQTYEGVLNINSQDIIDNQLYNEDYTLIIYARGTSSSGVQGTVNTIIDGIDLQAPEAPVIISSGNQYPTLTEYGVVVKGKVSIAYPENVTKLYSLDGENWQEYTGEFEQNVTKVYAKAIKKSGLETSVEATKTIATDALGINAYDGDKTTGEHLEIATYKYLEISSELINKEIEIQYKRGGYERIEFIFYDSNSDVISSNISNTSSSISETIKLEIPEGTVKIGIYFNASSSSNSYIYEISAYSNPVISNTKYYPVLTEYDVEAGYNEVTIDYYQTSAERLYRINEGEWKGYQDKAIRLELGDIIEVKGIDKYGKETAVSNYTAVLPDDALGINAYDGDKTTGEHLEIATYKYLEISSELINKEIEIQYKRGGYERIEFIFYDSNSDVISSNISNTSSSISETIKLEIPEGTVKIGIYFNASSYSSSYIYEISPAT